MDIPMPCRHVLAALVVVALLGCGSTQDQDIRVTQGPPALAASENTAELQGPYEDLLQQEVPFGRRSYYLSPWRSYMDTWPGSRYIEALGFCWNGALEEAAATFKLMSEAGFGAVRIEIGWNSVDFDHPDRLSEGAGKSMATLMKAARDAKLRPILLLNGHHGAPCPMKGTDVTLEAAVAKGSRQVKLSTVEGIRIGYSGIGSGEDYINPSHFITSFDAKTRVCQLSKPLGVDLKAGQKLVLTTLKYQPFAGSVFEDGKPNPASAETVNGWLAYVKAICDAAQQGLGSSNFDLEVWNEYTFGSNFLDIRNYYDPAPKFKDPITYTRDGRTATGVEAILPMTVDYAADKLPGVRVISGFANQRPWENGTEMWPRQAGFSRHFYTGVAEKGISPQTHAENRSGPLNALGQPDGKPDGKDWHTVVPGSYFIPTLHVQMPEWWHYSYQTEFVTRDIQPFPGPWSTHHRYSHPGTGRPAEVWMTEYNFHRWPWADQIIKKRSIQRDDPRLTALMDLQSAKLLLRMTTFNSHKGIKTITYFCAKDELSSFGLVPPDFYAQLAKDKLQLTEAARAKQGRQVQAVARVTKLMASGKPLDATRHLTVQQLLEHSPRLVFKGDGTDQHPDRYHRDDFAVLPFQLDADRYAVGYYVVTRDAIKAWDPTKDDLDPSRYDMPEQTFTITLGNVRGQGAKVEIYDPLTDKTLPTKVLRGTRNTLTVSVPAKDYPRFLMIKEDQPGPLIVSPKLELKDAAGAAVSFKTNLPSKLTLSWGELPNRTRDGSKDTGKDKSSGMYQFIPLLRDNAGVRVQAEADGLVCVWPRWGFDVQGVARWSRPATTTQKAPREFVRWPALPAGVRPAGFKATDGKDVEWASHTSGDQSRTLGQDEGSVTLQVQTLREVNGASPSEALPQLSTLDRVEIKPIKWSGTDAWQVELTLDAAAHPGEKQLFRRAWIAPLDNGVVVMWAFGTRQALEHQAKEIQARVDAVTFR